MPHRAITVWLGPTGRMPASGDVDAADEAGGLGAGAGRRGLRPDSARPAPAAWPDFSSRPLGWRTRPGPSPGVANARSSWPIGLQQRAATGDHPQLDLNAAAGQGQLVVQVAADFFFGFLGREDAGMLGGHRSQQRGRVELGVDQPVLQPPQATDASPAAGSGVATNRPGIVSALVQDGEQFLIDLFGRRRCRGVDCECLPRYVAERCRWKPCPASTAARPDRCPRDARCEASAVVAWSRSAFARRTVLVNSSIMLWALASRSC